MRKSVFFILGFSFLMFLFTCDDSEKTNGTDKPEADKKEVAEEKTETAETEVFSDFYEKFVSNETFQTERVKFPLEGKNIVDYDLSEDWTKDNWTLLGHTNEIDTNELTIEKKETETRVEHSIYLPHSGFGISYAFELIDGKWFLTERTDSNL